MRSVQVFGQAGSGRSSLAFALSAAGVEAVEYDFPATAIDPAPGAGFDATRTPEEFGEDFAADDLNNSALVVLAVSARDGLETGVASWWEELAESFTPRLLVWTFTDVGRADDDDLRAITERVLGEPNYAVALPLADDEDEFAGVLDLRDATIHEVSGDGVSVRAADSEHEAIAAPLRDELIDAVLANTDDEVALTSRMAGMSLSPQRLTQLLSDAIAAGTVVVSLPVRAVAPTIGVDVLADVIQRAISH